MNKQILATTSAMALLVFAVPAVHAGPVIATIYGIYDAESGIGNLPSSVTTDSNNPNQYGSSGVYDTPSLFFVNPSADSITGVQMTLSVTAAVNNGGTTYNQGVIETYTIGTLNANSITQLSWGSQPVAVTQGNNIFGNSVNLMQDDYDDIYGEVYAGNYGAINSPASPVGSVADCTLTYPSDPNGWFQYCAPTGNFQVSITGTLSGPTDNGDSVSALFGEYNTATQYVGWEGLDPNGWSENATYDVHSGTVSGVLADICIGGVGVNCSSPLSAPTVPEPGTLSLLGAGLGALALTRRRRKQQA